MNKALDTLKSLLTTKVLLITGGSLVILSVLAFGVVRYEQAEAVSAAQAKSAVAKRHAQAELTKQHVTELETATKVAQADKQALCLYVKQLDGQPLATKYVTVPQICN